LAVVLNVAAFIFMFPLGIATGAAVMVARQRRANPAGHAPGGPGGVRR